MLPAAAAAVSVAALGMGDVYVGSGGALCRWSAAAAAAAADVPAVDARGPRGVGRADRDTVVLVVLLLLG